LIKKTLNYLAHLYLSGSNDQLKIGNFIADHVKGSVIENYSGDVLAGIHFHRLIDSFTDQHPVVSISNARLRPDFRKYAPVISDVFFDHFLARNWSAYHHLPLEKFAENSYTLMRSNEQLLPVRAVYMLNYMESQNWLVHYASIEGIEKALTGLSKRTRFISNMDKAHLFLQEHYQDFENDFELFFKDIRLYVSALDEMK
jgi:acyl carrier protein phosphodiesterase